MSHLVRRSAVKRTPAQLSGHYSRLAELNELTRRRLSGVPEASAMGEGAGAGAGAPAARVAADEGDRGEGARAGAGRASVMAGGRGVSRPDGERDGARPPAARVARSSPPSPAVADRRLSSPLPEPTSSSTPALIRRLSARQPPSTAPTSLNSPPSAPARSLPSSAPSPFSPSSSSTPPSRPGPSVLQRKPRPHSTGAASALSAPPPASDDPLRPELGGVRRFSGLELMGERGGQAGAETAATLARAELSDSAKADPYAYERPLAAAKRVSRSVLLDCGGLGLGGAGGRRVGREVGVGVGVLLVLWCG